MTSPPIAGWKIFVRCGRRRKRRAERQQPLAEQQRHDAAEDPERRVRDELRGVHEVVGRARETAARCPRIERSTITAATDATTVEPSRAAFMSPMISSRANSTAATGVLKAAASAPAAPDRHEIPHPARRQVQPPADQRRQARADLHGRSLATHRMARADAQHAGDELAERHAARESRRRTGGTPLRSAARRCRARPERPSPAALRSRGSSAAATAKSRRREGRQAEQTVARLFDRHREQHGGESGQDADDDGQDEKDLMFSRSRSCCARRRACSPLVSSVLLPDEHQRPIERRRRAAALRHLALDAVDQLDARLNRVLFEDRWTASTDPRTRAPRPAGASASADGWPPGRCSTHVFRRCSAYEKLSTSRRRRADEPRRSASGSLDSTRSTSSRCS